MKRIYFIAGLFLWLFIPSCVLYQNPNIKFNLGEGANGSSLVSIGIRTVAFGHDVRLMINN